ncbi:MAG TPA: ATP-binding protein [Trebonia sp.]|nr:ATP-binding protein [Trebonia sp.]
MTAAYRPLLAESAVGSRALAAPGAEWHARVFAGVTARVPEARDFVADALAGCPAGAVETLLLCVTELCANAIEHTASGAGGAFIVEVSCPSEGVAFVAVTDGGGASGTCMLRPDSACREGADDLAAGDADLPEGGRGLSLVAAFASRWGYQPDTHTAWAEASWPVSATPRRPAESRHMGGYRCTSTTRQ